MSRLDEPVIFATGNAHKYREVSGLLSEYGIPIEQEDIKRLEQSARQLVSRKALLTEKSKNLANVINEMNACDKKLQQLEEEISKIPEKPTDKSETELEKEKQELQAQKNNLTKKEAHILLIFRTFLSVFSLPFLNQSE